MNDITVTMPIEEYERMKKQIETLKAKNVENFITINHINDDVGVDVQGIASAVKKILAKEMAKEVATGFRKNMTLV